MEDAHDDGVIQSHVLADGIVIKFTTDSVFQALLTLTACYFAWDLQYPRWYQLLLFFHMHVLTETSTVSKTTNFVKL